MIYLLETGVCLSFLYLAFWLFLRKETYFNFNRIYLVGAIVLAMGVPLIHLNFFIPEGSSLKDPAMGIVKFRSYYEEVIRMIDADFGTEPGTRHSLGRIHSAGPEEGEDGVKPSAGSHGLWKAGEGDKNGLEDIRTGTGISVSGILLIIYIGGVIYFLSRFVYLVIRLYLLTKQNRVTRQDGFRMVEIEEDISPFSFFHFLFINTGSLNDSDLLQVLEHERAHIIQKHSLDHLFAHGLAVFQWFNPFAWQIRKALKTTHEYIADRHVLGRGIELFDYQSLLLRQVIGYHAVELVNNFNLKPIKKRIAMMNKSKSGMPARLKAMLVIPFAVSIFFLFADFTLKESGGLQTLSGPDLEGLWIRESKDDVSKTLFIQNERFTYAEGNEIHAYFLRPVGNTLVLSQREGAGGVPLKYEMNGDELTLWWNDSKGSRYVRSKDKNTLDHFLHHQGLQCDLPTISQYRLMDEKMLYRIGYTLDPKGGTVLTFNGKPFNLQNLSMLIEKEQGKLNKLDQGSLSALFLIDRSIPMILVDQVRQELRKINALHIAEGGYPHGELGLSPLLYHAVALPRLLPPTDAKVLDKKIIEKNGGRVHTIDLSARNTTPRDVDMRLQQFIRDNEGGKYVISLEYDQEIPYGQYVETVDMIFNVVYRFRDELALKNYRVPYDKLGEDLQKEIRNTYPMALSESMKPV